MFLLGNLDRINHNTTIHNSASRQTTPKVECQSRYCPKVLPSGKPSTVSSADPVASIPWLLSFCSFEAILLTILAAIDQKTTRGADTSSGNDQDTKTACKDRGNVTDDKHRKHYHQKLFVDHLGVARTIVPRSKRTPGS